MALGEEQTRQAQNELNSVQNSLKVYRGQLQGLKDPSLIARKQKDEEALRKAVAANPEWQKMYGDACRRQAGKLRGDESADLTQRHGGLRDHTEKTSKARIG